LFTQALLAGVFLARMNEGMAITASTARAAAPHANAAFLLIGTATPNAPDELPLAESQQCQLRRPSRENRRAGGGQLDLACSVSCAPSSPALDNRERVALHKF
jgi:hypothetical protein